MSRTPLVPAWALAVIASASPVQAQGTAPLRGAPSGSPPARTFICHGGPGLQVRVRADPSPSWIGPATYPTKPVQMALQFAGPASFTDADKLPAGSCAWQGWDSSVGVPPREVYVDVNHASRPAPNPASIRADLADAKRFFRFRFNYLIQGVPFVAYQGEWIPSASSPPSGPAAAPTTAAGTDGIIRQLMCRGGPSGFEFRVVADPSPAYPDPPRRIRLAIRYRVHLASDTAELALGGMNPGSCGWDMQFGAPKPQGEVIVDLQTDAQESSVSLGVPRDTSLRAALSYPDTTTLKRYLSDPRHYWIFFHRDRGEPLVMSHAAYKPDLTNLFVPVQKASTNASGTTAAGQTSVVGSLRDRGTPTSRSGATERAPTTTGSVGGPLRDPSSAAASPGTRPIPTDSTARREAAERTPTNSAPRLPDAAVASSPGVGTRTISNLQVGPGPLGVRITFDAWLGNMNPTIWAQISTERPSWNAKTRQWFYPAWRAFLSADSRSLGDDLRRWVVEPTRKLEAGRRYYYLIEVRGRDPSRNEQRTGSFTADVRTPLNRLFKPAGGR